MRVAAGGKLDVNEDGKPEMSSRDGPRRCGRCWLRGDGRLCSSVPQLRVDRGRAVSVPLPACTAAVRWIAARWASRGNGPRIRAGRFVYNARRVPREPIGSGWRATGLAPVRTGPGAVPLPALWSARIGDSVTAGFGYYGNGGSMNFSLASTNTGQLGK